MVAPEGGGDAMNVWWRTPIREWSVVGRRRRVTRTPNQHLTTGYYHINTKPGTFSPSNTRWGDIMKSIRPEAGAAAATATNNDTSIGTHPRI